MEANKPSGAPHLESRFVILWHSIPPNHGGWFSPDRVSHFDWMFEDREHLITFEVPRIPIPSERIPLVRLPNHRPLYLEFEGSLSPGPQGEDRGFVSRWAAGTYCFMEKTTAGQKLVVELNSERFSGQVVLKPKRSIDKLLLPKDRSPSIFWTDEPHWELYVSRWAMKEKSCSKT
jgi:hypothetical protein